jgi:hypothetical protein
VGTQRSGLWVAATLASAAIAACLWLVLATLGDDAAPIADAATKAVAPDAARRSAPSPSKSAGDPAAVVEIDDAPLADDATFLVRGSVVDTSGAPVEGARVEVVTPRTGLGEYGVDSHDAKTGVDGSYVIEGLDARAIWSAGALADGFAPSASATAVLATSKRPEVRRDFALARLGAIDVVVLDDRGAPIAHRTWIRSTAPDDGGGEVGPSGLRPGRYRVFVSAAERAGDLRDVDVADGATSRVEFRLGPAVEISGVLVAVGGEPLSGYDVVAVDADQAPPFSKHRAKTGRDGSFTIRGLRRARYDVRLDAVGAERLEFTAGGGERVEAPADALRLTARAPATVRFHLVYPPGFTDAQRSREVRVSAIFLSRSQRVTPRWDYDRGAVSVPGGEDVEIVIDAPDCLQFRRRVCVQPGEEFDSGDFALETESVISGRVVDAKGRGLWPAHVDCRLDGESAGFGAGSDKDGWFEVAHPPPGEIVIVASRPGFADSSVRCTSGRIEPVVITLRRGGRLHVRATRADGSPLAGAALRLTAKAGDDPPPGASALDAFGESATRLVAGRWRVAIDGCGPVDVEVRENATTTVRARETSR